VPTEQGALVNKGGAPTTPQSIVASAARNARGRIVFTIKFKLAAAFGVCMTASLITALVGAISFASIGARASALERWLMTAQVALAVTGCLSAGCMGIHLFHLVCGGLDRMRRKFEDIATSLDLSKRAVAPRMDEFGRSAIAFDRLMQRIEYAVSEVRASSDTVTTATGEIAAGNLDLSSRTEEQAASLEQTAASMAQLVEAVRRNAENARQAHDFTTEATQVTDTGADLVQAMVAAIAEISNSSGRISEITGMIEGIAFQTNILALNAAVEAARAGAQGRGFAVVASEVRSLAQRSASATKEINDLIASSLATIRIGSQQASRARSAMDEVRAAIARVAETVGDIAQASDEQSRGVEQIGLAIGQIDDVTQQNAALVQQAAAATQSLDEQADRLKAAVASFKLSGAARTDAK
jgi:methyl-accepting chemotaxis protein